jgi:hypothetical protein
MERRVVNNGSSRFFHTKVDYTVTGTTNQIIQGSLQHFHGVADMSEGVRIRFYFLYKNQIIVLNQLNIKSYQKIKSFFGDDQIKLTRVNLLQAVPPAPVCRLIPLTDNSGAVLSELLCMHYAP